MLPCDKTFHTQDKVVKSVWPCYMANNILVMLAGIQMKSFYHLSTHDVTHMRNVPGPLPLVLQATGSWDEGLGMSLMVSAGELHVQET